MRIHADSLNVILNGLYERLKNAPFLRRMSADPEYGNEIRYFIIPEGPVYPDREGVVVCDMAEISKGWTLGEIDLCVRDLAREAKTDPCCEAAVRAWLEECGWLLNDDGFHPDWLDADGELAREITSDGISSVVEKALAFSITDEIRERLDYADPFTFGVNIRDRRNGQATINIFWDEPDTDYMQMRVATLPLDNFGYTEAMRAFEAGLGKMTDQRQKNAQGVSPK